MPEINKLSTDFNSINLLAFLYKKRKVILIVGLAAAILSSIVSLTMEEKFKSTVILFPSTTSSISKSLMAENPLSSKHDIMQFGEEEDAEQMLQILNSDEIRNKIVEKYNLMEHYKIPQDDKYKYTRLAQEFQSNISFKRTEFMSVKIEVLDKDPMTAANIANDIAALVDTVKNRMQKERALQGFRIIEQELHNAMGDIRAKEDSLKALRDMGIIDYVSQSEKYTEQYAIAVSKDNKPAIKALEERLDILAKYGGASLAIKEELEHDRKQLRVIKTKYDESKVDAEQNITHMFIVNRAVPAEKKSYPVRWLIVVVSTLSAMFASIIAIVILESINSAKATLAVTIVKDTAPVIETSVN
jgi:capsular polysaccharide biosynthesis protein